MLSARIGVVSASVLALVLTVSQAALAGDPVNPTEVNGDVYWGPVKPSTDPEVCDVVPKGFGGGVNGYLHFWWTTDPVVLEPILLPNGKVVQKPTRHAGYGKYKAYSTDGNSRNKRFYRPNDRTITDWYQELGLMLNGRHSVSSVHASNISKNSPWAFYPLADLPDIGFSIPDLAPSQFGEEEDSIIYTAVNLGLYLASNPNGFGGQVGQTLNDLGLSIVNGQIPGIQGIYWATTPFTLDANSATG